MRIVLILFLFFWVAGSAEAAFGPIDPAPDNSEVTLSAIDLSREAMEAKLGRKLKFKERIALSIARGKMKKVARRKAKGKPATGPVDGFAVASLVCGILGLFLFFTAIPALVLGIISLGRFKRDPQYRTGKGMAIAGVILGGLLILLGLILIGIILVFGL